MLAALGFPDGRTPCQSTLQRLFRQLDGDALSARLSACFAPGAAPATADADRRGWPSTAKRSAAAALCGGARPLVHALSAFCHEQGIVLAHEPIAAGADKAEAELTVAPALLARIDWRGRVLTGDALFCQTALCAQVLAAGGRLRAAGQGEPGHALPRHRPPVRSAAGRPGRAADRPPGGAHAGERARPHLERRELVASTDLTGYLDWPGAAQVFRLERTWREHGQAKRTLRYGITSLAPAQADAARLLALRRGHWSIENRLHRHKDVNFGEDASLIHVGAGRRSWPCCAMRRSACCTTRASGASPPAYARTASSPSRPSPSSSAPCPLAHKPFLFHW